MPPPGPQPPQSQRTVVRFAGGAGPWLGGGGDPGWAGLLGPRAPSSSLGLLPVLLLPQVMFNHHLQLWGTEEGRNVPRDPPEEPRGTPLPLPRGSGMEQRHSRSAENGFFLQGRVGPAPFRALEQGWEDWSSGRPPGLNPDSPRQPQGTSNLRGSGQKTQFTLKKYQDAREGLQCRRS